jgi:hypothetical protein
MKIQWTRRGKSIAIAAALFLLFLLAHIISNGQPRAKQFIVTTSCINAKCKYVKIGRLAITPDSVFIRLDGQEQNYRIIKKSKVNGYTLYEFDSFVFLKLKDFHASIINGNDIQNLTLIR